MDWKVIFDLVIALLIVGFLLTIAPYVFGFGFLGIVALFNWVIQLFKGDK